MAVCISADYNILCTRKVKYTLHLDKPVSHVLQCFYLCLTKINCMDGIEKCAIRCGFERS
ncbi:Protein of unknown function, partial [Gryllus bimaculatus]